MAASLNTNGVLYGDSTQQNTAFLGGKGQVFTSSGTFTVPTGITAVKVIVIGGGGAGGGTPSSVSGIGAGGGAGGVSIRYVTGLTPGGTVSVTIGAAGAGGTGTGGSGGTTSFGAYASATGGAGGTTSHSTGGVGGSAGVGSSGDINITGGAGAAGGKTFIPCCGSSAIAFSGAGGGSVGQAGQTTLANGLNSNAAPTYNVYKAVGGAGFLSGAGGTAIVATGGSAFGPTTASGNTATGYGNGGSGGANYNGVAGTANGGSGTAGICIVEW